MKVTPACESLNLKVADDDATGLAGSVVIVGVGVVTVKVSLAAADGVFEPTCASTLNVWDPPDDKL